MICRIDSANRESVNAFITQQWFTTEMVVHGACIDLSTADGWIACENGDIIGLITYRIISDEMEILSLDSLIENTGIGTALLNEAVRVAKAANCRRIMVITTNDNLRALRFYQKRGFDMVRLYRNAVKEARKRKPQIPLIGMDDIPLRHEIELELKL
jgi:GNAT superfamily N-acetyltransferase